MNPSSRYSTAYTPAQAKFDLAVRARAALLQQPGAPADAVQRAMMTGQRLGGSSSTCYNMQQLQAEAGFLAGQMRTLRQVCVMSLDGINVWVRLCFVQFDTADVA